ncbi:STAS/SEC14 domain-containing protein [Archangium lipolyticum]|uniref:STAS/SEC14 domain-containing protein n=1 Tax=Archangium lipolyticum TaxID=2970465 RepID=UPI00214A0AF3|nr:STAS/SEC14 domain-containing protein [Archangium lipolyticum]
MKNAAPPIFDDSRWPLLRIRFPRVLSATEYESFLGTFADYLLRSEKLLLYIDLSRVGMVPIEQRWRQVEWFEQYDQRLREQVLGSALVITSPVIRLALSAITYFKPLPNPVAIFARPEEAEAWAAERLQEAGLTQASQGP